MEFDQKRSDGNTERISILEPMEKVEEVNNQFRKQKPFGIDCSPEIIKLQCEEVIHEARTPIIILDYFIKEIKGKIEGGKISKDILENKIETSNVINDLGELINSIEKYKKDSSLVNENSLSVFSFKLEKSMVKINAFIYLLNSLDKNEFEEEDVTLTTSLESAESLYHILENFRDFCEGNHEKLNKTKVNLKNALKKVVDSFINKYIQISCEIICPVIYDLYFDRFKMNQVFFNIIQNAVNIINEAIENGKMTKGKISITVFDEKETEKIMFYNNGPQIPEELQEKVFESLFTTRKKTGGTGMGLSICKRIVELHEGTIEIENKEEKDIENKNENDIKTGVTFIVTLPKQ